MGVAKRDPFHPGAHDAAYSESADYTGSDLGGIGGPRLARTVNLLQVVGSILAIPVGLASAYSIYHANFSVDTTCKSLRAGIVSMIDKSVDAGTRRMLVRRDVETFEQTCGSIDPDATAAFKALLAADKPAAPVATPAVHRVDVPPADVVHKAESHPQGNAKPATVPASAVATVTRRDPTVSDDQWVDAVRQALLTRHVERPEVAAKAPVAPAAISAQWPTQREASAPAPLPIAALAAPVVAPALPPATSIAAPAAPQTDGDHPVPPAAIPETVLQAQPDEHSHSRIRRWIAKLPLMGNVIDNGSP